MGAAKHRKVFVANRGEIALRIIEACDRLGIETVLGVSAFDKDSLPAQRAGQTVVLGPSHASNSYLNVGAVTHAAIHTGCTALHPGYGFLSERVSLARACAENNLIFIGPRPEHLEVLGDKLSARRVAEAAGVPVSPGGATTSGQEALDLADQIGYPVLVKAAFGGGGRGMKLVHNADDLVAAWELAASEAQAAFGDGTVFVERFIANAKHIEVQILGDQHGNHIHLAERECSVQYRYQKMLEEAPCNALSESARNKLHGYALSLARQINYQSLGTIEFLYDVQRDAWCFLEVNPRVQVEHPVTESVTGIDLIREQILVAFGEPLSLRQQDVQISGHAIELRLTAQDAHRALMPSPGTLTRWRPAPLGGVRLDTHLYENYRFPPHYDALMAKIIAWGPDRNTALERLTLALHRLEIEGPRTNLALLQRLVNSQTVLENSVTTRWLEDALPQLMEEPS
ncbi:acetyl/propionyl/methylcrotonyl-CoA carboxylase subunit alpha [Pusillimonas sp. NJUB218]|uniref:acetyl-CoA carboxylase biotin carboxylase subunit n=1 Tax=Pusillimonas sp. NJUB218 TaxID=2023230 RepID=UPI000F4BF031|nr:biotin carboxylase N-terminal domain-containing protein [Pusillimonas sp. NJUB218]ROT45786.1 acetyl-CoA carboxylase biotin carboxylase subunit [Pusillimonas sp. NJUB218]